MIQVMIWKLASSWTPGLSIKPGHARVYDLVGTTWTQVDDDIDGEEANDNLGCSSINL